MQFILGRKVGMTRALDREGNLVGATVIQATPNVVTQVKTTDRDGYVAVQVAFGDLAKAKKPQQGHAKKVNADIGQTFREVRPESSDAELPELGSQITVATFKPGDVVNAVATSKGHGFTGTVKRHNFAQGPRSHGSMNVNRPGSIGAQQPQRVIPGKRMAGHMGDERVTVKHLEVLDVMVDNSLIILKGAVPGIKGALIQLSISPRHQEGEAA